MEAPAEIQRMSSWISFRPEPAPKAVPPNAYERSNRIAFQRIHQSKSGKRSQGHLLEAKWEDPYLVKLCREKRWIDVVRRCRSCPEETIPQVVGESCNRYNNHAVKRIVKTDLQLFSSDEQIFHETALGISCTSAEIHTEQVQAVIKALVMANPSQLTTSQLIPGHTPLRDALKNPHLTPKALRILTDSTDERVISSFQSAVLKSDRNGLLPLDHLIIAVQLGSHPQSLLLLKEFIKSPGSTTQRSPGSTSPLIRLLSLGTSFGSKVDDTNPTLGVCGQNECARLDQILGATKCLLQHDPSLIDWCSRITGCSPLHVALRNYGDYAPLIRELVSKDTNFRALIMRNHYGDLPLHVACSVGVPMVVLRLIIEQTLMAAEADDSHVSDSPNLLLWSVNNSGYTPIDLEWVRHIESGKSFYSARSFYPLEPTGVRKHCFKQDEYYQALLREAVDQLIQQQPSTCVKDSRFLREEEAKSTFGVLIDRIKLLVSSAATKSIQDDPNKFLLHNASKLCNPTGPNLPLPLLELILWMQPDQLKQRDSSGNLPIHYALHEFKTGQKQINTQDWAVWQLSVLKLLSDAPETAKLPDANLCLPLHLLLLIGSKDGPDEDNNTTNNAFQKISEKLIQLYPESVDVQDPTTKLYPFMLAAMDSNSSLDLSFDMLRHSPSRCCKYNQTSVAIHNS